MLPTLLPGQTVVAVGSCRLRVGDIIIFTHNGLEKIKRIAQENEAGLYVAGDNPAASTDSRQFGLIARSAVVGRIVWPRLR